MGSKRKAPARGLYLVAEDYATTDLDGRGSVLWSFGTVVELDDDAARWVNGDRPGTLRRQPEVPTVPNADGDPVDVSTLGGS